MNALAKTTQDNDLRFSPGLFLSGLEFDKLDGIEVDRQKRIIDRSRQFSHMPRFIPQEFVEAVYEPDIVDSEMNVSPLRHHSYRLWTRGLPRLRVAVHAWYIYMTLKSHSRPLLFRCGVGRLEEDVPVHPYVEPVADRNLDGWLNA